MQPWQHTFSTLSSMLAVCHCIFCASVAVCSSQRACILRCTHNLDASLTGAALRQPRIEALISQPPTKCQDRIWIGIICLPLTYQIVSHWLSNRQDARVKCPVNQISRLRCMTPFLPPLAHFIVPSPIVYLPHSSEPVKRRHMPPAQNKHQSLIFFPPFYP